MYSKVKKLCDARGISVYRLESELGLPNGTVGKWKTSLPSLANAKKVSDFFGISMDMLIDGIDLSKGEK